MSGPTTISRRTILRGVGTAIALPMLDAMLPSARAAARAPAAPRRMAFIYVPNGMHMPDWTPAAEGRLNELPPILDQLSKHRNDLTVLSGLTLNGARALGDGGGDHARSVAAFLTGAHPRKTDGADIQNGISVDQLAAERIGGQTRFPSLELGLERSAQAGKCDSGYSCVYTSNMSWRSATSPVAKEINPQAVFDRLFANPADSQSAAARSKRERYRKSVLDFVLEDAGDLRRKLGGHDQQKLDEYLHAVRDIERRLGATPKLRETETNVPDFPRPAGVPQEFADHLRLMFDMMVLAMQSDSTRVLSLMFTNAGSNRNYPQVEVGEGHHNLSHHGNNQDKQAKISKINQYHARQFAYFIDRLSSIKEGEGRLLDHSMVMYGSGIGDGNRHNHDDLPIVLAGGKAGMLNPGRHVRYKKETPLTNLYVALLRKMGVRIDQFGDSTGVLEL